MSCWFPRVVAFGVSRPLDQVLQLFSPPLTLVAADGLDFVLFSPPHEVRWWPGVVFPMFFCFAPRWLASSVALVGRHVPLPWGCRSLKFVLGLLQVPGRGVSGSGRGQWSNFGRYCGSAWLRGASWPS